MSRWFGLLALLVLVELSIAAPVNIDSLLELLKRAPSRARKTTTSTSTTTTTTTTTTAAPSSCSHGLSADDIALFRSRENVTVSVGTSTVTISSNGWPDHAYGDFPNSDNPNTISTQNNVFAIPLCPELDEDGGSCLPPGPVGVAVNGIPIFNPFNINGEDALEVEVMDLCDGHPDMKGIYHYHGHPGCVDDGGDDTVLGVAYDGYPILGPYTDNGRLLTSDDLDDCHGETLADGSYRYRVTFDYPYILGCFMGEVPSTIARKQGGSNCYFAKRDGIYMRSEESKYKKGVAAGIQSDKKRVVNDDAINKLLGELEDLLKDN